MTLAAEKSTPELSSKASNKTLQEHEQVIERNLTAFYEEGGALLTIRDQRLYNEAGYSSFTDYCKQRWDMSGSHADRLIGSSVVVDNVAPIGAIQPANEAQVRPLTKLSADLQKQAWGKVIELAGDGKVTAKLVKKAVDEIDPPERTAAPPKKADPAPEPPEDQEIPAAFEEAVAALSAELKAARDDSWRSLSQKSARYHLQKLLDLIEAS